jgi:multisubunit Na+/H+ antiporter MnhB subunit
MPVTSRSLLAILATGLWVNASEFFRNEVLLKPLWIAHYESLGQRFPSEPVNGAMWVAWGFLFAVLVFALSRRFALVPTAALAWLAGFVLMWIVMGNLNVLPSGLLPWAVPLSLLEAFVAAWVSRRVAPPATA